MPTAERSKQYHSNQYTAASECKHCAGIIRHEPWCITRNQIVSYAYEAIIDPGKLTLVDELFLHALGVQWAGRACNGRCQAVSQNLPVE
jgi:hypothetical protein